MPGEAGPADDGNVLQEQEAHDAQQAERVQVVVEVWRRLGEREMPGTDLVAADATAQGAVFGDGLGDLTLNLRERFSALLGAGSDFGMRLQQTFVAPGGEVVGVGVARGPRTAWLIAIVNEFRGTVISHATAYQDVGEALASVGLAAADTD